MADITVTIGAQDDGSLAAAMQRIRGQVGQADQAMLARGQQISEAFAKGVIPPGGTKFLGPEDLAALQAYEASLGKVNNAQKEIGETARRSGINIETMFERMVIRAGIAAAVFGTIHEILKAFAIGINFEKVQTQFQYLIGAGAGFETQMRAINEESDRFSRSREDLMGIEKQLYRLGDPMANLTTDMQMVDQYAKVTGEDVGKIAHGLTDLRLGRASIDEMYDMTALLGQQGQALHDQIADYEKIEAQLPRIQREQELNFRLQEHQWTLMDRQRDATNRLTDAQSDFANQVGITKKLFDMMREGADPMRAARAASFVGDMRLDKAAEAEGKRLQAGEKQIEQEEELSEAEVKRLERQGLITAKTLEAAAQRRREEQQRAQQQDREDQRFQFQMGLELMRYDLEQKAYALQQKVLEGMESFTGLSEGLAKTMQTAAAAFDKLGADIKNLVENLMPALIGQMARLADELDTILKNMGALPQKEHDIAEGIAEAGKKMGLPAAPFGKEEEQPWETREKREKEREGSRPRFLQEEHEELRKQRGLSGAADWLGKAYGGAPGGIQATQQELFDIGKKALMAQGVNRPDLYYSAAEVRAAGQKQLQKEAGKDPATEVTQVEILRFLQSLLTVS